MSASSDLLLDSIKAAGLSAMGVEPVAPDQHAMIGAAKEMANKFLPQDVKDAASDILGIELEDKPKVEPVYRNQPIKKSLLDQAIEGVTNLVKSTWQDIKVEYLGEEVEDVTDSVMTLGYHSEKELDAPPPNWITRDMIPSSACISGYKHHWAVTLEPMGAYSPPNPFSYVHNFYDTDNGITLPNNLLPAISFRYDTYRSNNEEISFGSGYSINVPSGYSYNKSITVSVANDCQDAVRNYLRDYRKLVAPSFKVVRPYKDCCSRLTVWIYTPQGKLIARYVLFVIPDLSDESLSDQGVKAADLSFNILGEEDGNSGK